LHGPEFLSAPEGVWCAECGTPLKEGQFCCLLFHEHYLCSESCTESFRANWVGRDFIAAHDQASEKVRDALAEKPSNFIFLYSSSDYEIHTCIMALPQFVQACVPLLVQFGFTEGDVQPPPD
jgi:hypothetical protein